MKKPADLVYGVDEKPPPLVGLASALQHAGVASINVVYLLVFARQAGLQAEPTAGILGLAMVAMAFAVLLHAIPRGPVGSHFLTPVVFPAPYLAPGLLAIQMGGMELFWGMVMVAGLTTVLLASIWEYARVFIPPESAGLVVFLVGAAMGIAALGLVHQPDGTIGHIDATVVAITFAAMVVFNVWGKGTLRAFSILIGIAAGYVVAAATGVISSTQFAALTDRPLISIPGFAHIGWSFDATLVVPFAVTALACAITTMAVVTTCQRLTDADWVRPEPRSITSGIRGDGIATVVAGLVGTSGVGISPANVGLVGSTGTASRIVAVPIAAILLLAAIQPALAGLLTLMPAPVMAAALLFPATFIMLNGVQIICSRVMDARRTLVIGTGVLMFLLVAVFPQTFRGAPAWLAPIVGSPLVFATLVALALNLLFRIGIRRTATLQITRGEPGFHDWEQFVQRSAGGWGARVDAIARLKTVLYEAIDAVMHQADSAHPVWLELTYDEFDIDARLTYRGPRLPLTDRAPTPAQILQEDGHLQLAGFMVGRLSDRMESRADGENSVLWLRIRQ
jgi:xanthine permease XanP